MDPSHLVLCSSDMAIIRGLITYSADVRACRVDWRRHGSPGKGYPVDTGVEELPGPNEAASARIFGPCMCQVDTGEESALLSTELRRCAVPAHDVPQCRVMFITPSASRRGVAHQHHVEAQNHQRNNQEAQLLAHACSGGADNRPWLSWTRHGVLLAQLPRILLPQIGDGPCVRSLCSSRLGGMMVW
jgi:hypothetical protein